jgi:hypothetical protein
MGEVPDGATGILVTADSPIDVTAIATLEGAGGQADISSLVPSGYSEISALAIPDALTGTVEIANMGTSPARVTVDGLTSLGISTGAKDLTVPASSVISVPLSDLGSSARVLQLNSDNEGIRWGFAARSAKLSTAKIAGISFVNPTSLDVRTTVVTSVRSQLAG